MRCVRCGLPSKNYEMSNDGRPAADPYARLDAAYLLGALDADERLAYEAHLAICRRCRAGLAEISAIPSLLAGLDESVFAAPPEVRGALPFPDCGSLVRPAARSPAPAYADLRSRRDETGPVSQGRWLVSLTRWTAANPRPCHWISLMQAEPRYSR